MLPPNHSLDSRASSATLAGRRPRSVDFSDVVPISSFDGASSRIGVDRSIARNLLYPPRPNRLPPKIPDRSDSLNPLNTNQPGASFRNVTDTTIGTADGNRRRMARSSNTWTSSEGEGLTEMDEVEDRTPYVQEYNRLAERHGLRQFATGDLQASEQGLNQQIANAYPHGAGEKLNWFSRKVLRKTSSSHSIQVKSERLSLNLQIKHDRQLNSKRSFSNSLLIHKPRKDALKDKTLQELVRLCGSSLLYLPAEYATTSLSLPTCFRATAQYLVQHAPTTRGVFRINGSQNNIAALYNHYCTMDDNGEIIAGTVSCPVLPEHIRCDVHDVASAFKKFLTGLPGGILGSLTVFDALISIQNQLDGDPELTKTKKSKLRARLIALAIQTLSSRYRRELICAVFGLLCMVGRAAETTRREDNRGRPLPTSDLMGYGPLGVVFGPLLLGDLLENYTMSTTLASAPDGSPVVTEPRSRKERQRKSKSSEENSMFTKQVDKVKLANGITEMLVTHWREVIRHTKNIALRKTGESKDVAGQDSDASRALRPSASESFNKGRPPDWDSGKSSPRRAYRTTSPPPMQHDVDDRSYQENQENRGSRSIRSNRENEELVVMKQRSIPRRVTSRTFSQTKSRNPLSPTMEEKSLEHDVEAGSMSSQKRQRRVLVKTPPHRGPESLVDVSGVSQSSSKRRLRRSLTKVGSRASLPAQDQTPQQGPRGPVAVHPISDSPLPKISFAATARTDSDRRVALNEGVAKISQVPYGGITNSDESGQSKKQQNSKARRSRTMMTSSDPLARISHEEDLASLAALADALVSLDEEVEGKSENLHGDSLSREALNTREYGRLSIAETLNQPVHQTNSAGTLPLQARSGHEEEAVTSFREPLQQDRTTEAKGGFTSSLTTAITSTAYIPPYVLASPSQTAFRERAYSGPEPVDHVVPLTSLGSIPVITQFQPLQESMIRTDVPIYCPSPVIHIQTRVVTEDQAYPSTLTSQTYLIHRGTAEPQRPVAGVVPSTNGKDLSVDHGAHIPAVVLQSLAPENDQTVFPPSSSVVRSKPQSSDDFSSSAPANSDQPAASRQPSITASVTGAESPEDYSAQEFRDQDQAPTPSLGTLPTSSQERAEYTPLLTSVTTSPGRSVPEDRYPSFFVSGTASPARSLHRSPYGSPGSAVHGTLETKIFPSLPPSSTTSPTRSPTRPVHTDPRGHQFPPLPGSCITSTTQSSTRAPTASVEGSDGTQYPSLPPSGIISRTLSVQDAQQGFPPLSLSGNTSRTRSLDEAGEAQTYPSPPVPGTTSRTRSVVEARDAGDYSTLSLSVATSPTHSNLEAEKTYEYPSLPMSGATSRTRSIHGGQDCQTYPSLPHSAAIPSTPLDPEAGKINEYPPLPMSGTTSRTRSIREREEIEYYLSLPFSAVTSPTHSHLGAEKTYEYPSLPTSGTTSRTRSVRGRQNIQEYPSLPVSGAISSNHSDLGAEKSYAYPSLPTSGTTSRTRSVRGRQNIQEYPSLPVSGATSPSRSVRAFRDHQNYSPLPLSSSSFSTTPHLSPSYLSQGQESPLPDSVRRLLEDTGVLHDTGIDIGQPRYRGNQSMTDETEAPSLLPSELDCHPTRSEHALSPILEYHQSERPSEDTLDSPFLYRDCQDVRGLSRSQTEHSLTQVPEDDGSERDSHGNLCTRSPSDHSVIAEQLSDDQQDRRSMLSRGSFEGEQENQHSSYSESPLSSNLVVGILSTNFQDQQSLPKARMRRRAGTGTSDGQGSSIQGQLSPRSPIISEQIVNQPEQHSTHSSNAGGIQGNIKRSNGSLELDLGRKLLLPSSSGNIESPPVSLRSRSPPEIPAVSEKDGHEDLKSRKSSLTRLGIDPDDNQLSGQAHEISSISPRTNVPRQDNRTENSTARSYARSDSIDIGSPALDPLQPAALPAQEAHLPGISFPIKRKSLPMDSPLRQSNSNSSVQGSPQSLALSPSTVVSVPQQAPQSRARVVLPAPESIPVPQPDSEENLTTFSSSDVALHNKPDDLYISVAGNVCDLTTFQHEHPGGDAILTKVAGKDVTEEFWQYHKTGPSILKEYKPRLRVGILDTEVDKSPKVHPLSQRPADLSLPISPKSHSPERQGSRESLESEPIVEPQKLTESQISQESQVFQVSDGSEQQKSHDSDGAQTDKRSEASKESRPFEETHVPASPRTSSVPAESVDLIKTDFPSPSANLADPADPSTPPKVTAAQSSLPSSARSSVPSNGQPNQPLRIPGGRGASVKSLAEKFNAAAASTADTPSPKKTPTKFPLKTPPRPMPQERPGSSKSAKDRKESVVAEYTSNPPSPRSEKLIQLKRPSSRPKLGPGSAIASPVMDKSPRRSLQNLLLDHSTLRSVPRSVKENSEHSPLRISDPSDYGSFNSNNARETPTTLNSRRSDPMKGSPTRSSPTRKSPSQSSEIPKELGRDASIDSASTESAPSQGIPVPTRSSSDKTKDFRDLRDYSESETDQSEGYPRPRNLSDYGTQLSIPDEPEIARYVPPAKPKTVASDSTGISSDPSLLPSTGPSLSRGNSVLHSEIRILRRDSAMKDQALKRLKQQLNAREDSEVGTLSEQLRETKRELKMWKKRAEVAEKRVEMLEKLSTRMAADQRAKSPTNKRRQSDLEKTKPGARGLPSPSRPSAPEQLLKKPSDPKQKRSGSLLGPNRKERPQQPNPRSQSPIREPPSARTPQKPTFNSRGNVPQAESPQQPGKDLPPPRVPRQIENGRGRNPERQDDSQQQRGRNPRRQGNDQPVTDPRANAQLPNQDLRGGYPQERNIPGTQPGLQPPRPQSRGRQPEPKSPQSSDQTKSGRSDGSAADRIRRRLQGFDGTSSEHSSSEESNDTVIRDERIDDNASEDDEWWQDAEVF